jgi:hypothetical protein
VATASRVVLSLAITLAAGCASFQSREGGSSAPARAWPATLADAQAAAGRGDFEDADSLLARFATAYPGTPETLETAYWRGLFRMDPSNHAESMPAAMASLDGYLADRRPRPHVAEATTLRRLASQIDGLNRIAASTIAQPNAPAGGGGVGSTARSAAGDLRTETAKSAADAQASDAEIKRLRDELAKANAELDRIKRRLSQPPPPER